MEAPDNIFLLQDRETRLIQDFWVSDSYSDSIKIEYTRTDAFIEKAVEYIANNMKCDGYTLQTKAKFIASFKKYMKG